MSLIEEIISDWAVQRPDIDCGGKSVVCRILRTYSLVVNAMEKSLKPFGITPTIFSILVTIRRKGPHAEVTVKKIIEEALVTSGAMSNLINKLVALGLVIRRKGMEAEKEDLRSSFIRLTPKGLKLINKAMEVQAACERKLTQQLTIAEKKQLAHLLKKMQQED